MPEFTVIAEFIDKTTGQRKRPGDTIKAEGERESQLKKAGVIGAEIIKVKTAESTPASELIQRLKEAEVSKKNGSQEEAIPAKRRKARG